MPHPKQVRQTRKNALAVETDEHEEGVKPAKAQKAPLEPLQKVERALASQGRAQSLAPLLAEEEQAAIAATVGDDGFATPDTVEAVRVACLAYYDRTKAVDGDHDPAPQVAPAAPVSDPPTDPAA